MNRIIPLRFFSYHPIHPVHLCFIFCLNLVFANPCGTHVTSAMIAMLSFARALTLRPLVSLAGTNTISSAAENQNLSRYVRFTREEWSRLRASTPLTLSEADLRALRGITRKFLLKKWLKFIFRCLVFSICTLQPLKIYIKQRTSFSVISRQKCLM